MATPNDVAVFKCCKICPTGNMTLSIIYLTKTILQLPLKLSLLRRLLPKSARASPQHFTHDVPNFI